MVRVFSIFRAVPVIVIAVLASCSSGDDRLSVRTGWLGSLGDYERASGEGISGVFVLAATHPAAALESARLAPVEITLAPGSDTGSIDAADFDEIRAGLAAILGEAIRPAVALRDRAGPDTYELRIALTGLSIKLVDRRTISPGREDFRFGFAGTALEAELREGSTNLRRAVIVLPAAPAVGTDAAQGRDEVRWGDLPARFRSIAAAFRADLETAKQAIADVQTLPAPAGPEEKPKPESGTK
ncbi:MAG: hypothetical protein WD470_12585 [Rhodospirillaceae bacterium]